MSTLRKHDLSIWPVYLTQGRRAQDQCIIAHLWRFTAKGEEWTLASLKAAAGCTITKDTLDNLVEIGVLSRTNEEDRPNAKTCHEYALNYEFLPANRAEPAKKAPGKKVPGWVFRACKIWGEYQGVIPPRMMLTALIGAVQHHGEGAVMDALEAYARKQDARFNPSPYKLAANIVPWLRVTGSGQQAESRSLADME